MRCWSARASPERASPLLHRCRRGSDVGEPGLVLAAVEAVEVHHLGPRGDEVVDELLPARRRWRRPRPARAAARSSRRPGRRACRSTSARPLLRSRPSNTSASPAPASTPCLMSSRLTKKSLLSVPGRCVKTPCLARADVGAQHAQAADQHRHLGRRQRQQLRLVDQQRFGRHAVAALEVVAEAVGHRLERRERLDVGLLLRRVRAARREGHGDRRGRPSCAACSTRGAAGQHDQVGERDLLAARLRRR